MNLVDVLHNVTNVDSLGLHLGIPGRELDKIRQDFRLTEDRKRTVLQWWLNHTPNPPTWEMVITALRAMHEPVLADAVAVVSTRSSLYEPCEEDSPKWENIDHKKKLDKILENVLQRSEHLEKEWEKGENEWREYLEKLEKIEQDWENLVKTQQTRRAYLTLGLSCFLQSDSESLHRYSVLEQKVEKHVARSKALREFYVKAADHQLGLKNTEIELKEWEKQLLQQASELQERINQMEKLGGKFLEEAKGCRKQLDKLGERLENCRINMNECRYELTKSHRQLQKCREKLIECEVNLESCRDELGNNHSQITQCINKLKKQSEDLSDQIETLTVAIGGLVGGGVVVGVGAGVGAGAGAGAGAGIGALIGLVGGPIGAGAGAAIGAEYGAAIGAALATISAGVGGVKKGMAMGKSVADGHEKQLEEQREMLRRCESELNACGNVVERCKKVLMKSEEELQELKKIVNELEQAFRKLP